MPILVTIVMVLTLLVIAALMAMMILTALDPRYVHPALHAIQRVMQAHMAPEWVHNRRVDEQGQPLEEDSLAIFDELIVAEHEAEFSSNFATELRAMAAPTLTSDFAASQSESFLFLRAEIAMALGFDLDIRATTANLTHHQYSQLVDYAALAFDTIETPESYLGRHGITDIHFVPRRGGFGYHSIGKRK